MSRLVMLPMRHKRQVFYWFWRSRAWVCVGSPTERLDTAVLCARKFSKPISGLVSGLTQESARLDRNNAVRVHLDIQSSRRPRSGGPRPAVVWPAREAGGRVTGSRSL